MNRTPRVVVLVALGAVIALGGCGPTAREIAAETFKREVAALEGCCRAGTQVEMTLEYQRRYRALAERHGQPIDDYTEALIGLSALHGRDIAPRALSVSLSDNCSI